MAGARDSGRASLFVFGSEADALAWFYTYRSGPRRSCRRVAIGSGGCLLPGTVKGLRRPTLDVVEGPYVVSVRVIQRTLDVAALRALALAVLAKAMSLR